ncbi:hypothetical protein EDC19_1186 [Natranaerovirga hydrolytica]|uniref:Uncharacterized protein n=1 Tax=Natranaerovirga hydrolytica TaxID=680378 RepID=A0A4V2Q1S2_9FIRM|nr:zinc ribbon domain-containing protein [Natranaerovirga hydrolytica]TCK98751.1 hypothetical protein EDC19_1186 [Natranaerovirga hydrolytica]
MNKVICKRCGEINADNAVFCLGCQSSLRTVGKFKDYSPAVNYGKHNTINRRAYEPDQEVSMGEWIVIIFLEIIPMINLMTLVYLAFGSSKKSLNNYGKASLLFILIAFVRVILKVGWGI